MTTRSRRTTAIGLAAAALTAVAFSQPASAVGAPAGTAFGHQQTQAAMDAAVTAGVPGVTAEAVGGYSVWMGVSGVGDLTTGVPRTSVDRYRIGSMTKTFVATVLLQLEAEGRVGLDDPVAKWLPGVVRGNGNDGTKVTVRQLLNHTSGIYSYTSDPAFLNLEFTTQFLQHRYDTYTAAQLVAMAMNHAPLFAPGTGWSYSNTDYVLAGMIIQSVTGQSYAAEVQQRILQPLGLFGTSLPGTGATMPQPSSRAYSKLSPTGDPSGPTYDVTELNPSEAGAAGEMVSDSDDLNRFYSALLGGRVLPARQLKEMMTTVSVPSGYPFSGYGLGVMRFDLRCGVAVWGHAGGIQGSVSEGVTTADGGHSLAFNLNGDWAGDSQAVVNAEFCPS